MSSTFLGLSIANNGLYASQTGLLVTNNNISNVNTPGYSRETINQIATSPDADSNQTVIIGNGPDVTSVDRVRDPNLDLKYWRENSSLGEWQTKSSTLTNIESLMGSSNTDFSTTMNTFYSALQSLSNDPSDSSVQDNVMETGSEVCSYLNNASQQLQNMQNDLNDSINTTVSQIDTYTSQIASINGQIQQASSMGVSTNDLEDQSDELIDQLSQLVNITVNNTVIGTNPDGTQNTMMNISINGVPLVNGSNARQLQFSETQNGVSQITWQDTNGLFVPGGGELKGYYDMQNGTGTGSDYQGIPYYISQLNQFARTFAEAFNEGVYENGQSYYPGQAGGYGSDGSTGIRFFTANGESSAAFEASGNDLNSQYANITAANISVSQDIQNNPDKIATAASPNESGDNTNISDLINICNDNRMFTDGSPQDFMNSIVATLGTNSAYSLNQSNNESTIVNNINNNRSSVSGVSTNEETANLTKYQQAYNASAEMVTTWNEIYQATIDMVNDYTS